MAFRLGGQEQRVPMALAVPVALVDARETVSLHAGTACLISEAGDLVCANAEARLVGLALRREVETGGAGAVLRLVRQSIMLNRPLGGRLSLSRDDDPSAGPRTFDVTLLPCQGTPGEPRLALLLGTETTLERNLRQALISSRDLFRDLVSCSADFAWETDSNGVFTFVSARGALGFSADALHGRPAPSLIDLDQSARYAGSLARSPFSADEPVEDIELWLRGADSQAYCFLVSAIPVHDAGGRWRGARGVGRDITALRRRDAELARIRAREDVSRAIVEAILSESNFTDMLSQAARAVSAATRSERAWVLCREGQARYDIGAAFGTMPHGARHFLPPSIALPILESDGPIEFEAEGWQFLGAPTRLRGSLTGALCIARPRATQPFDAEVRALIDLLAKHAAVAIAQASQLRTLTDLSLSDELTGLANRRAFTEAAERWRRQAGTTAQAALLCIDLDDFKRVNDEAGHAAGDHLLRTFASLLRRDSRKRDLAVRLGGDEFVLWIEGIGLEDALGRAKRLIAAARDIPLPAPLKGGLHFSIGVAGITGSAGETLDEALARADGALYEAKHDGKGRAALAPAPGAREEGSRC